MTERTEWRQVKIWATERIERYRNELEGPALTEAATAVLRGRIAELRDLLAIGEPVEVRPPRKSTTVLTAGPRGY